MLSKSQAKAFFLIGTAVCTAAFIGLTVDTLKRIPQQTHSENLTPEVIRGKHLWENNNCMGCHTLFGEGAYYAPELTKVYARRGASYMHSMLKDPQAMFPNGRKMTQFNFKEEEIQDLIQFLKWCGEADLNGFPAKTQNELNQAAVATSKRPQVFNQVCTACHSLGGSGGSVGPALDGVGTRLTAEYITQWLHNPTSVKADAKMPQLTLSENEINELTVFLSELK